MCLSALVVENVYNEKNYTNVTYFVATSFSAPAYSYQPASSPPPAYSYATSGPAQEEYKRDLST